MERSSIFYKARRKIQALAYNILPKEFLTKLYYKVVIGGDIDLKNPKKFNEKMQWCKLYYYPNNPLVVKCADKYAVREYVSEKGLDNILTKHYGVWDNANDITWSTLPDKFILKCNHGCAYNILCSDKNLLNEKHTKKILNSWLKEDFGRFNIEPHYSKIERRVVFCEEYLGAIIDDYKFFCFNGKPRFLYVARGMIDDRNCSMGFFELDGRKIPVQRDDYSDLNDITFPPFFEEMLNDSKILCKEFEFVRVDFFVANGKYYFAEMTFAPGAAMMPLKPGKYDIEWGAMLDISDVMKKYPSKNK